MSRARPPDLHDRTRLGESLIESNISLWLESAILHQMVVSLFLFVKSQNQVLLLLIQGVVQPVGGIDEFFFIQWLL
jgi:hypothetical protein